MFENSLVMTKIFRSANVDPLEEIKKIRAELEELKKIGNKLVRKPARRTAAKRKTVKRKPARRTAAKRKTVKRKPARRTIGRNPRRR